MTGLPRYVLEIGFSHVERWRARSSAVSSPPSFCMNCAICFASAPLYTYVRAAGGNRAQRPGEVWLLEQRSTAGASPLGRKMRASSGSAGDLPLRSVMSALRRGETGKPRSAYRIAG